MHTPEIMQFIREHSNLFWYTPEDKKEVISDEFLVETILNYGDMDSVVQLFQLMGINQVAEIFFRTTNLSDRRRGNYQELTVLLRMGLLSRVRDYHSNFVQFHTPRNDRSKESFRLQFGQKFA